MERKNAYITVIFLCLIMLTFMVADFWKPDKLYSENENRVLAEKPQFSKEALLRGEYTEDYEEYVTDQFIGRDTWIMLKTRGDILLQKKDINGVYLGKDGYLIEQHLPADIPQEKINGKIELLKKLAQRYNTKVMLIPTADNVISNKLPDYAQYYRQRELIDQVKGELSPEQVVDVYPALKEHEEEDIYYRTDHHWTTLGAYYSYQAWVKQTDKMPYVFNQDEIVTVTDSFLGTLHSKLNLPMEPDKIQVFGEIFRRPVKVTYDYERTTDSFFEPKYLDTKNKYGYFLDDNHPFIEIETDYKNGKELFLIKNSFANCIVPFLALHYEKIYMLDLRYYNGKLFELIDQYQTQRGLEVLVLYDGIHFIEDFQYY